MFPFYTNNDSSENNINKNIKDNYNNNYQDINSIISSIVGNFNTVFNQVLTTLVQNEDLINNIIDNVLNSDAVNSIINTIEEKSNFKLREYEDRYLIEGKLLGINKKDIDVDYENDHIKISVKKNLNFNNGRDMIVYFHQEGSVLEETYYVPNVDERTIKAVYDSNTLRIYLKKKDINNNAGTIIDVEDFSEV